MSVTVEKLEAVYEKLLTVVKREVECIADGEDKLESADVKALETHDKILRSAMQYYLEKKPDSVYAAMADDDLQKEFD